MSAVGAVRHTQVPIGMSSIHVAEAGHADGPAVMFLHGWPQSWRSWRSVMRLAAPSVRAIAIDLPGVGASLRLLDGGVKGQLARQIHTLIELLGLEDFTLVGHDIGGMVAYSYLRQYHDVARVVIMDTVIPGVEPWNDVLKNPHLWHFAFHGIPSLPELLVQGNQAEYFSYFFDGLSVDPSKITPEARREYVGAYHSESALSAGFDFYRAFLQDAQDNIAFCTSAATDTPVLYLRGAGEGGGIDTYADGLRNSGVRNLTTAVIADAGHFTPEEMPAEVWRTIHEFIAR
jgi:pimeloyl-ACP methyl ester carboxylesterase